MAKMTKKQLADSICQALFQGDYIYADKEGEEKDPEIDCFERMGYVKLRRFDFVIRERVTFFYDNSNNPSFQWSCYDPFDLEGEDAMAAFLSGFMYALFNGKAVCKSCNNPQLEITFVVPDTTDTV